MVPVVSLLQRFHCTGQLTVFPMVSLLQRFHCTGQLTVVPVVSLLQRFHCTGQLTVVPVVSLLQRFHCTHVQYKHWPILMSVCLSVSTYCIAYMHVSVYHMYVCRRLYQLNSYGSHCSSYHCLSVGCDE